MSLDISSTWGKEFANTRVPKFNDPTSSEHMSGFNLMICSVLLLGELHVVPRPRPTGFKSFGTIRAPAPVVRFTSISDASLIRSTTS